MLWLFSKISSRQAKWLPKQNERETIWVQPPIGRNQVNTYPLNWNIDALEIIGFKLFRDKILLFFTQM